VFEGRVIALKADTESRRGWSWSLEAGPGGWSWSPHSPDLSPLDFSIWNGIKNKVFVAEHGAGVGTKNSAGLSGIRRGEYKKGTQGCAQARVEVRGKSRWQF